MLSEQVLLPKRREDASHSESCAKRITTGNEFRTQCFRSAVSPRTAFPTKRVSATQSSCNRVINLFEDLAALPCASPIPSAPFADNTAAMLNLRKPASSVDSAE